MLLISARDKEPTEAISKLESDRWTISTSTAHAGYPVSKLKTDNLSDYARAYGQRRSHTRIEAITDQLAQSTLIEYVAILGLNRVDPSAIIPASYTFRLANQARLIIDSKLTDLQRPLVQSSGFTLTNLTGAFSILNQPVNPPEDTVTGYVPTSLTKVANNTNTQVVFNFAAVDAARPLKPVEHVFLIHAKDSVNANLQPTLTVTLRRNGADVTVLTASEIEKTSEGFLFKYVWEPVLLGGLLTQVGLKIVGSTTGTSTPEPIAVTWWADVDNVLYDSGWQNISEIGGGEKVIWIPVDPVTGFRGIDHPSFTSLRVLVEFSDFVQGVEIATTIAGGGGSFAYSYTPLAEGLHVGRFGAGRVIDLPLKEIGGFNLRKSGNNQGALTPSYGGHFRSNRTDLTRWEADFSISPQAQETVFNEINNLFRDVGFAYPCLYIPDDDMVATGLWAIITAFEAQDLGEGVDESATLDDRFDIRVSVIEAGANRTGV